MNEIKNETKMSLRKAQAVLAKIATKQDVFFNIHHYVNELGLVREHGKNRKGITNYVLTEKGKKLMNFQI